MGTLPDRPDPEWDDETEAAYWQEVNWRIDELREERYQRLAHQHHLARLRNGEEGDDFSAA